MILVVVTPFHLKNHWTTFSKERLECQRMTRLKLISATADGASVNFGMYNGLISKLKETRPWLLSVHCANHRVELAIKDAILKDSYFTDIDDFYQTNFYLLRNSGSLKSQIEKAAGAIGITYYCLTKLSGTRFVGHRKEALTWLIHMWPCFITAYKNAITTMRNASTKAKVQGLLKKFCNLDYLYKACAYLDVVEVIVPCSKVFESSELLPFHLAPTLKILDSNLTDMVDNDPEEIAIDSHVRLFTLSESEDGKQLVKRTSESWA